MRLLFFFVVICGTAYLPTIARAALAANSCSSQLDAAVSLFNNGNSDEATDALTKLADTCAHLPQVHHNLGVIAATNQQWYEAEKHFERAITDDKRSNSTYEHLQSIHQFKAALAYRKALDVEGAVAQPRLTMQNASDINAVHKRPPETSLHNAATLDYELFSWWTAAANGSTDAWLDHYATGYPPLENTHANEVQWDNVSRDIAFTTQDAVVVLNYKLSNIEKRIMLLLRLQNNRWKIYRETTL